MTNYFAKTSDGLNTVSLKNEPPKDHDVLVVGLEFFRYYGNAWVKVEKASE